MLSSVEAIVANADEIISFALDQSPADHLTMKIWPALFCLLVTVGPHAALGFDPARVDQVKYTKQCPKCDSFISTRGGSVLSGKPVNFEW